MKAKIHPQFYSDATVTCACGYTFTTGSTKKNIFVEVCSRCHPLYTGQHRYIDTKGKVEQFEKKRQQAEIFKKELKQKRTNKKTTSEKKTKSLKELLAEI